jgi:cbb3-type cytochrome oxidase subunit 1
MDPLFSTFWHVWVFVGICVCVLTIIVVGTIRMMIARHVDNQRVLNYKSVPRVSVQDPKRKLDFGKI